ncbi:MAG: hypothetical protein ACRC1M_07500 [Methanobacteriaceae archaeon]
MDDSSEITISAPLRDFIKEEFFKDYFIDYVREKACGRLEL